MAAICPAWRPLPRYHLDPDRGCHRGPGYPLHHRAVCLIKFAGTIGDIGCYSFNGNKIITTGAGGAVVSNHPDWAEHAKHLSTQAKADVLQFLHDEVGYNYRMTNVQACLGPAQLERLEDFIAHKRRCMTAMQPHWTA